MKKIEDILNMECEALEEASRDVQVPEGLQERIAQAIAAHEVLDEAPRHIPDRRFVRWLPYSAVAAAIIAVSVIGLERARRPKDTFDDPYLAYAQVEETFRYISDKMSLGMEQAIEAKSIAEKPIYVINKLQGK